jgi:Rieske Fe-S protein
MSDNPTRRTVLHGAGAAGAAAVTAGTLAACGSGTASTVVSQAGAAASQAAGAASGAASAASAAVAAIKQADIPVGGGKIVDKVVITQPTAGTFKAFSAVCTHQGCTVSKVENAQIICACHNSVFDATTGAVVSGPAKAPLPAKGVSVSADGIKIT